MTKKMITTSMIMLATLFLIGTASAAVVDVTTTGATDPVTGAYIIPVNGASAFASVNLQAEYSGWVLPGTYNITVRAGNEDPNGAIVWQIPTQSMLFSAFTEPILWVPTTNGLYTVYANGIQLGKIRSAVQVVNPTPEMSTGVLMSAGLIGLVGMIRYRRKE